MLSKLRQFRVKGLGYISLGLRVPNFPISQIVLGHVGWGHLGNWEIGKFGNMSSHFPISQIALGHTSWGDLGNWETCTCSHFPSSQFPHVPNRAWPDGLSSYRKLGIGKMVG